MALTKLTKQLASYHTWTETDISDGDIIGVQESLGRPANQVTIKSTGGDTTVRFNVSNQIFRGQSNANPWLSDADFWTQPYEVTEVEIATDDIIVLSGTVQTWYDEFPVRDIKIVSKAPGLTIIVT